MAEYAFTPPETWGLPIAGTDVLFPVRRVYCVGRNYAAHVVEMGHDPERSQPFFFQKNPDNLDASGKFPFPPHSDDVHHEAELAVMLHSGGRIIPVDEAMSHVFGYAAALDMTRRDLQAEAKKSGRPWEVAKAFEHSAPIGLVHKAAEVGHISSGAITLEVNGERRQEGDLGQMIWKVPEMISYLSEYFELAPGDVILTGTPSGVSPVARGDRIEVRIAGLSPLNVTVV